MSITNDVVVLDSDFKIFDLARHSNCINNNNEKIFRGYMQLVLQWNAIHIGITA